jgi:hypothetical protein
MWKRRDPSEPEPPKTQEARPEPAAASPPPVVEATVTDPPPPPVSPTHDADDPYAELENFFNEPLVLEDIPPPSTPPSGTPQAEARSAPGTAPPALSDTVQRLEQFGQRLAARFEALEGHVQEGSAQTLEALRRLGERMGSELAMLEKRAVNLELTMARLRATTEALELSLRKLPSVSNEHAEGSPGAADEPNLAESNPEPELRATSIPPAEGAGGSPASLFPPDLVVEVSPETPDEADGGWEPPDQPLSDWGSDEESGG